MSRAGSPENASRSPTSTLHYPGGFIAHIHVNWLAPLKIRRVLLGGSRRMVVWDDLEPTDKVKLYDSGIEPGPTPGELHYRTGGVTPVALDVVEPLRALIQHFADCVLRGARPLTGGAAGFRVVRLLEARGPLPGSRWSGARARNGERSPVIRFTDLQTQHAGVRAGLGPAIPDVLAHSDFGLGRRVRVPLEEGLLRLVQWWHSQPV